MCATQGPVELGFGTSNEPEQLLIAKNPVWGHNWLGHTCGSRSVVSGARGEGGSAEVSDIRVSEEIIAIITTREDVTSM